MTKKQASRPSVFTEESADEICDELASGMTFRDVCRAKVMPG